MGVSFYNGPWDSIVSYDSVSWGFSFNDISRGAKGVPQGSITHSNSFPLAYGQSNSGSIIAGLCMLNSTLTSRGKGLNNFLHGGGHREEGCRQ